jgi:hypothetical protein
MDAFRFEVFYRVDIRRKVSNRRTTDNSKCLASLHVFAQLDRLRIDGPPVVAECKVVAPVGLCSEIEFSLRFSLDGPCEMEKIVRIALFQFQFQLFNGARTASHDEPAPINGEFDLASPGTERPSGAMNRSLKDWLKLSPELFRREALQRGSVNFSKIGCIAADFSFPFAPAKLRSWHALDGLNLFAARLPNAKRKPMTP